MSTEKLTSGQYSGTVTQILATCGMVPKFMAISGDPDPSAAEPLGGKVLGINYRLGEDTVTFNIELNYFINIRGRKESQTLSAEDLRAIQAGSEPLSRRMTLSLLQSQFDPLGLICPALLKGKMMLQELHTPELT